MLAEALSRFNAHIPASKSPSYNAYLYNVREENASKNNCLMQKSNCIPLEPNKGYTVMSNHHLRNKELTLFEEKLLFAIDVLRKADLIIFIGMGSSGTLAKYGARYFSNMGHFAVGLEDALYPIDSFRWKNTVVIAFSESGETERLIEAINQFKKKKCCVLSITNSPLSTLAKLSDWNFSYNLNTKRINGGYNGTTQAPVIFVIETLAKRI